MTCSPRPFDVVVVPFEFEDRPGVAKPRPAVVVDADGGRAALALAKVTSHAPRGWCPGEVALLDWEAAGLKVPSTVRCSKVVVIGESAVKAVAGALSARDAAAVAAGCREAFGGRESFL